MVPRGLSVAEGPWAALHNVAHLYSDQATRLGGGGGGGGSSWSMCNMFEVLQIVYIVVHLSANQPRTSYKNNLELSFKIVLLF